MIDSAALVDLFKKALAEHWGYIWGTAGILWTQARQNQKVNYLVKTYGENWKRNADAKNDHYYMCGLYGAKWINHTVADCSGMFVWAFKQYGMGMSHISSNIYKSYCGTKGQLTDALKKTLLPGTAVFTGSTASNHPHVGLYVGNGKVIESHGTQAGVVTANITENRWTWYGLLKNVSYPSQDAPQQPSAPVDDKTPTTSLPTLRKGSTGEYVTLLQTMLKNKGYDLGKYGVDGDFGSATLAAVKSFQKANGLDPDGVVGSKTWAALQNSKEIQYYTVIVNHLTESQADALVKMYDKAHKEPEKG